MQSIVDFARSFVRPFWAYVAGIVFAYMSIAGILNIETIAVVIGMVVTHYFDNRQTDKLLAKLVELQNATGNPK